MQSQNLIFDFRKLAFEPLSKPRVATASCHWRAFAQARIAALQFCTSHVTSACGNSNHFPSIKQEVKTHPASKTPAPA